MFICTRCKNVEEIALAPVGTRKFYEPETCTEVCFSCLGLLQRFANEEFIKSLCELIKEQQFEHKYIRTSLLLPSCLYLRQHLYFQKTLDPKAVLGLDVSVCLSRRVSYIKNAWREICVPLIEKHLGITHIDGDGTSNTTPYFDVMLTFDYAYNDLECWPLREYFPKRLQHVKPLKRPIEEFDGSFTQAPNVKPSLFTLLAVNDAISSIPLDEFPKYFEKLEKEICGHPEPGLGLLTPPQFSSQHLYVYGRYQKFCRDLPQSTWTTDGGDDCDDDTVVQQGDGKIASSFSNSIEQVIGKPLMQCTKADSFRFSAAGREDVDVRMLGKGRTFCFEIINPRTPSCLSKITESELNAETSKHHLSVFDLSETMSRYPLDMLKQGEGQKEKEYTAICFVRHCNIDLPNVQKICNALNSTNFPLPIKQHTPIRVLHRRSPVVRTRHVLKLEASPFQTKDNDDTRAFVIRLRTDAGTYIKEFVHGDLGRTVPNIGSLILSAFTNTKTNTGEKDPNPSCECDIVTLDVTDISDYKTIVPQQ